MPARIDVLPDSGLLVVHDADVRLPVVDRDRMDDLEREAAAAGSFSWRPRIPSDFEWTCHFGEPQPPELREQFQPLGGSFLLDLPSGRLIVAGYNLGGVKAEDVPIAVPRGPHILTVMERRPVDGRRHRTEIVALVGDADWKFSERTDRLAFLGCLPTILAVFSLLVVIRRGQWRGVLYTALALAVLAWAPHVIRRNSKRYQRIQRRMNEHEAAKPHFILNLAPTDPRTGLPGGFLNV